MGSGKCWGALAKVRCQSSLGGCISHRRWHFSGPPWELELASPEARSASLIVALAFLCYPLPYRARSSQLGPLMPRTSQSLWGLWGQTLDAVWISLPPGRTSSEPPVTVAHASCHRVGHHRLLPTWLVSHHPITLPPQPFGRQQGLSPDPLGHLLCLRANVRGTRW